jgi:hypothetical protein
MASIQHSSVSASLIFFGSIKGTKQELLITSFDLLAVMPFCGSPEVGSEVGSVGHL